MNCRAASIKLKKKEIQSVQRTLARARGGRGKMRPQENPAGPGAAQGRFAF
jgi:hypothetical protein